MNVTVSLALLWFVIALLVGSFAGAFTRNFRKGIKR